MTGARKRALLVGATGVVGRHVLALLQDRWEVVRAGLDGPDLALDLARPEALQDALAAAGPLDAIISTAGRAHFRALAAIDVAPLAESVYGLGLADKLMGQVNLVLAARPLLPVGASITLTSGTTSEDPILGGSSLSMVNGALEHWVRAAATELRGLRLNVVSPSLVEGTPEAALRAFPGFEVVSGRKVAQAYLRCLESGITGQVLRA